MGTNEKIVAYYELKLEKKEADKGKLMAYYKESLARKERIQGRLQEKKDNGLVLTESENNKYWMLTAEINMLKMVIEDISDI